MLKGEKQMKIVVLLLFLFLCGLWDWKSRKIPLWLCGCGALAVLVCEILTKEFSLEKITGGILIGLILLGAGKVTKGQIGSGDGIVFIVIGLGLRAGESFLLLVESLWVLFLFCLIGFFTGKIKVKERVPFLPFVFFAYVLRFVF